MIRGPSEPGFFGISDPRGNPVSVHHSRGNPVSVHHSCPKRRTDTGLPRKDELTPDFPRRKNTLAEHAKITFLKTTKGAIHILGTGEWVATSNHPHPWYRRVGGPIQSPVDRHCAFSASRRVVSWVLSIWGARLPRQAESNRSHASSTRCDGRGGRFPGSAV